jgi:coenzyme F420-reducing hydrogenase alpha subunit
MGNKWEMYTYNGGTDKNPTQGSKDTVSKQWKEIMDFVNAKVNRFSRISEVVEEKDDFAKTPTHKIKRFLYNRSKDNDKPQREQPAGKPETK